MPTVCVALCQNSGGGAEPATVRCWGRQRGAGRGGRPCRFHPSQAAIALSALVPRRLADEHAAAAAAAAAGGGGGTGGAGPAAARGEVLVFFSRPARQLAPSWPLLLRRAAKVVR